MTREDKFSHDVIHNYHKMIKGARRPKYNMHIYTYILPALLKDKWTHNEHLSLFSLQISHELKSKTINLDCLKLKQGERIPTELMTNISPQSAITKWYLSFPQLVSR